MHPPTRVTPTLSLRVSVGCAVCWAPCSAVTERAGVSSTRSLISLDGAKFSRVASNVVAPVFFRSPPQHSDSTLSGFSLSSVKWKWPIGPFQLFAVLSTNSVVYCLEIVAGVGVLLRHCGDLGVNRRLRRRIDAEILVVVGAPARPSSTSRRRTSDPSPADSGVRSITVFPGGKGLLPPELRLGDPMRMDVSSPSISSSPCAASDLRGAGDKLLDLFHQLARRRY